MSDTMPVIELIEGDILATTCEAIVSPVDCTGAQGAGLAKTIRLYNPEQCHWYRKHASKGNAEAGEVYFMLPYEDVERTQTAREILDLRRNVGVPPLILFATTKTHWSRPSRLEWVDRCCSELVDVVRELGICSLAIPALGCGLGQRGIEPADAFGWPDVRRLILTAAERMACARVEVYEPHEQRQRGGRRG